MSHPSSTKTWTKHQPFSCFPLTGGYQHSQHDGEDADGSNQEPVGKWGGVEGSMEWPVRK